MADPTRRVRAWGWGWEDTEADDALIARVEGMVAAAAGGETLAPPSAAVHKLGALPATPLPAPRFQLPATLASIASSEPYDRVRRSRGMSLRDSLRAMGHDFSNLADWVIFPRSEGDVAAALQFCAKRRIAVVPRGGGTSVVGGLEATQSTAYTGTVVLDLRDMNRILEVDHDSMCVRVQGGMFGPALERALSTHGYTLRHYPQSFEFSTVGGWVATRAGGHFATGSTHIDESVQALRIVTPTGVIATPRVPASGAGPDPKRLFIGSEGSMGVITEVWLRVQRRPSFRAAGTVKFPDFATGGKAVRAILQAGLRPANCRLVSPMECLAMGLGDGSGAVLLLAFESCVVKDLRPQLDACKGLCDDLGGEWRDGSTSSGKTAKRSTGERSGAAGNWRKNFISAPYIRDVLAARGALVETFETAVTWDRFEAFYHGVSQRVQKALRTQGYAGVVTCRLTHAYQDGCAPYFTVFGVPLASGTAAPAPLQSLQAWDEVKSAAGAALLELGGTCTHHHAVGRDHRPFYEKEVGPGFLKALAAVKSAVDPEWICNPGLLIPMNARAPRSRL